MGGACIKSFLVRDLGKILPPVDTLGPRLPRFQLVEQVHHLDVLGRVVPQVWDVPMPAKSSSVGIMSPNSAKRSSRPPGASLSLPKMSYLLILRHLRGLPFQ